MRHNGFRWQDRPGYLHVTIRYDGADLISGCHFWQRHNICMKMNSKDLFARENFEVAFYIEASTVSGAVDDCPVNVFNHVPAVELGHSGAVNATLAWCPASFWVVRMIEELWTKGVWIHGLYCPTERGSVNQDSMAKVKVTRGEYSDSGCNLLAKRVFVLFGK